MENVKAQIVKYLPFFFVFMAGSLYGEFMTYRAVDGDCKYLAKFRLGTAVYDCVKYVSK